MTFIPPPALPHLESAVVEELRRLERVADEAGDWPNGFDPNDIPLYAIVLKALREEKGKVDLSGKLERFLLLLVPSYVETNLAILSDEEYNALSQVYERQEEMFRVQFPSRK